MSLSKRIDGPFLFGICGVIAVHMIAVACAVAEHETPYQDEITALRARVVELEAENTRLKELLADLAEARAAAVPGACELCNDTHAVVCRRCAGKSYAPCRSCAGKGSRLCRPCKGLGTVRCRTCYGGPVPCTNCRGRGYLRRKYKDPFKGARSVKVDCGKCVGGKTTCYICKGATLPCPKCEAGAVTCPKCDGTRLSTAFCSSCKGVGSLPCPRKHGAKP